MRHQNRKAILSPRIVTIGNRRYVHVGKKRIKVAKSITERELIMWMIKFFGRKRKSKSKTAKLQSDFATGKPGMVGYNYDSQIKDVKDATAKLQDKLAAVANERNAIMPSEEMIPKSKVIEYAKLYDEKMYKQIKKKEDKIHEKEAQIALLQDEDTVTRRKLEEDKQKVIEEMNALLDEAEEKLRNAEERLRLTKAKTSKLEDKFKEVETLNDEISALHDKLHHKAAAEVAGQISKYTAAKLQEIAGISPNEYKRLGYTVDVLREELLDNGTIDRKQMEADYIKNNLSEDDKKLTELMEQRDALKAERQAILQGDGKHGKTADGFPTQKYPDGTTDNMQLDAAMKDYPQYLGTVCADEMHTLLPKVKKMKRVCWIMNTDTRGGPGQHWIAFFIDARAHGTNSVEYYDPLADKIPPEWQDDLKAFIREMGVTTYLKFRENLITDQSNTSNNCGPFCIHFLQSRLQGNTFAKATGWDKAGEKNIEIWKQLPKQQMWISGTKGEGLRDIWNYVRKGATKVYERIKQTIGTAENGVQRASPQVRGWLAKYGDLGIEEITICKKPIYSMIETIGNWLSLGKLRENMDRLGYDRLMHLYMHIKLRDGPTIKLEKNHVVEIKSSSDLGKQQLAVATGGTVGGMLAAAEKKYGDKLWQYDAKTQNCQYFTMWFLGDRATPAVREFVMQDAVKSLEGMGLLEKAARAITDVAAVADVAVNGAGNAAHGVAAGKLPRDIIGIL